MISILTGWRGYAAAAILGFGAGWLAQGWRADARTAKIEAALAEARAEAAAEREESANRLAALEASHNEIERLTREKESAFRAGVERGRIGLRVNVAPSGTGEAKDAGMGEAGAAELAPTARPDYFALREGLTNQYHDLMRCYAYVRELTED